MDIMSYIEAHPPMRDFFSMVTASPDIQTQLYQTVELSDVSLIAEQHGFDVPVSQIVTTQAMKLLTLNSAELQIVASGGKPNHGCQWGRGGHGYLNRPGYWLNQLYQWHKLNEITLTESECFACIEQGLAELMLQEKMADFQRVSILDDALSQLKAINETITLAQLCQYLGQMILHSTDKQKMLIGSGHISGL